jgi:hypothetical protein
MLYLFVFLDDFFIYRFMCYYVCSTVATGVEKLKTKIPRAKQTVKLQTATTHKTDDNREISTTKKNEVETRIW